MAPINADVFAASMTATFEALQPLLTTDAAAAALCLTAAWPGASKAPFVFGGYRVLGDAALRAELDGLQRRLAAMEVRRRRLCGAEMSRDVAGACAEPR